MERYEIEAVLTLADELHFGRAAERLRVSTGRVSQTIQALERRIGAPLFERTSRRVSLTPVGAQFADELRPAYDLIRQAIERATSAGRGIPGVLEVGFTGAGAGQFVMEAAETFGRKHPGTEVRIRELPLFESVAALRNDLVDVALVCYPVADPDLTVGPVLRALPRMLVLPLTHPLARRTALTQEDLADITLIGAPTELPAIVLDDRIPQFTPSGRPIRHGEPADTFQEAISLVGAGKGGFIVGDEGSCFRGYPGITYLPIEDGPPLQGRLTWRTSRETGRIKAFHEAALAVSQSHCRTSEVETISG
ncbi:LysR substrate-binding domain-containing protein [Nocardia sp. NPDC050710]|uniref:LysR substrate-binding domain-containing protein n=1 Tax=Nocardia sp. NPDC050710 TaxID=3157220 RepID=UPI0033EE7044